MSENSDIKLWQKIKEDDEQSLSKLFYKYYEYLYQFAGRYLDDAQLAENVVQDVFVHFWENRKTININTNLKSYLFTSTKNNCINYIEQHKKKLFQNIYTIKIQDNVQSPELKYIENELTESIQNAINLLPDKCRQVYILKRYDGFKYKEISEILNISVNTVKTQMKRAVKFLVKKIAPIIQLFVL